jgi:iron complex outermembrane receptor protein
VDKSYRTGIELEGAVRISTKLSWNANLSVSQNKIKNFEEVLYDYGVNFDEYNEVITSYANSSIAFSPNVIAGSAMIYTPVKGIELGLLTKYVGKQYLDNTTNEARQIDAYFINDLRMSFSWRPTFMKEISISLLANNIFNVMYSSNGYTYGYFGGLTEYRQNYYYPQAGRNYMVMLALRF